MNALMSDEQATKDWQMKQMVFHLNLSLFDATRAVACGVDYHELENLLKNGCAVDTAIKILSN